MRRRTLARIHMSAAASGLALVGSLLVSSSVIELTGDAAARHDLRLAIVLALPALVACLAAAGLTGQRLTGQRAAGQRLTGQRLTGQRAAGQSRAAIVGGKQRRMRLIAAAGAGVLVPCAIALPLLAGGPPTLALEITEIAAGLLNFALLVQNFRDGRRLTAARRLTAGRRARRRLAASSPPERMIDTSA